MAYTHPFEIISKGFTSTINEGATLIGIDGTIPTRIPEFNSAEIGALGPTGPGWFLYNSQSSGGGATGALEYWDGVKWMGIVAGATGSYGINTPNLTQTEINNITNPAPGMIVYNTTTNQPCRGCTKYVAPL